MFCMFCACLICFYLRATVSVVFYLAVLFRDVLLYCYYLHVYVLFLNKWYSRSSHRAIAIVGWSAINCASSSIHYRRVAHARTCLFKFLSLSLSLCMHTAYDCVMLIVLTPLMCFTSKHECGIWNFVYTLNISRSINDETVSGIQDAILDLWWRIYFR